MLEGELFISSVQVLWEHVHGDAYLHEMRHGEAFLGFIQDSSKENGLYFLDEPEAALSPSRQLTLLYEMDRSHGTAAS